jgi:hypothetical protein
LTTLSPDLSASTSRSRAYSRGSEAFLSMRTLLELIMLFIVALLLGTGSAQYMIEYGSPLTTKRVGPWASWIGEGNPNADHYTKAHLARSGRLPLTSTTARYFLARTDSAGSELTSDCQYLIEGFGIDARWWSLAVYDDRGSVIENPSARYSFNSDEAVRRSDGTFHIILASTARPENWLPSGSGAERKLVLMLRVYGPRQTDSDGIGQVPDDRLPKIERTACN